MQSGPAERGKQSASQTFWTLDPESMFKEYGLQRVQSLEEKLEDLDSLSLFYWPTKFVQEVANKNSRRFWIAL